MESDGSVSLTGCNCLFIRFLAVILLLVVFSCYRDYGSNHSPTERRSSTFQPASSYGAPATRQAPTYYQQQPAQPYYYGAPNSRSYYNPYDFQQPYGRNPYSDYDQYYVPPTRYYNNEYTGSETPSFSGKN